MTQTIMSKRSWIAAWCHAGAILVGIIFCPFGSHGASAKEFVLASRGQPKAEIVAVDSVEPPLAFAVQELRRYVKEMSGAELGVVHSPSKKPAIVLTVRPLQQDKQALEDPRERDHYRLSADAKKLHIDGASPRAVL